MADRNLTLSTTGAVLHRAAVYDLLVWLLTLGRERAFREKVVGLARLERGESVLDLGCGTGTLAIAAKRIVGPTGTVYGIDASPEMIARARNKAAKTGAEIVFQNAVAEALPLRDAQFDAVLTSMVLHHLPSAAREQCFREVRRVLKPGGRLLAVDFGGPQRERRGLIAHLHRRVQFDLGEVVPVMSEAGLNCVASGAVGFGNLQFVLAAPGGASRVARVSEAERKAEEPQRGTEEHSHPRIRARKVLLLLAVIGIIAGHVGILYYGLSHVALSGAVVAGVIVLVVIKHLGLLGSLGALVRARSRQ